MCRPRAARKGAYACSIRARQLSCPTLGSDRSCLKSLVRFKAPKSSSRIVETDLPRACHVLPCHVLRYLFQPRRLRVSRANRSDVLQDFPMIELMQFRNFKVLRDTQLPLSRFTLIVGPNGSGKSTVMQALRAVSQPRSFTLGQVATAGLVQTNTGRLRLFSTGGEYMRG